jgi:hypothetical protein
MTIVNDLIRLSISGYPGWEADNEGHVYKDGNEIFGCENGGYIKVWCQGKSVNRATLVCISWHGPKPFDKAEVRHLNDDHVDDRPFNLAWGTHLENMFDAIENDVIKRGQENGNAKLSEYDIFEIRRWYDIGLFIQRELAEMFNVSGLTIHQIIARKTWRHI